MLTPLVSPLSLQVRKEMQARVPVTPPESAEWLGRMMAEIWAPFVGPLVLKENLGAWQVGGGKGEGQGQGKPPGTPGEPGGMAIRNYDPDWESRWLQQEEGGGEAVEL